MYIAKNFSCRAIERMPPAPGMFEHGSPKFWPILLSRYLRGELQADMEGMNVAATVYIEDGWVDPKAVTKALEPTGEVVTAAAVNEVDKRINRGTAASPT